MATNLYFLLSSKDLNILRIKINLQIESRFKNNLIGWKYSKWGCSQGNQNSRNFLDFGHSRSHFRNRSKKGIQTFLETSNQPIIHWNKKSYKENFAQSIKSDCLQLLITLITQSPLKKSEIS